MVTIKKIIRREQKPMASALNHVTGHSILKQIYANRDITEASQLDLSLSALLPYHPLAQIDQAVNRLCQALEKGETIVIFGDYDVDGATSTVLALRLLKAFGAQKLHYLIPNRFSEGYGITPDSVHQMKIFDPQLIVTVDNGMAGFEAVETARTLGIDVIITDHHLASDQLPSAVAVVNPNQSGDQFGSKHLAGVGVVFYLMMALRAKLRELNWFEKKGLTIPNLANYLDLVALGTVADVVPLDQNNRILVNQGIARIRRNQCSLGIAALLAVADHALEKVVCSDLSYTVTPRLNAAGRLDHMSISIECLLADDLDKAMQLAQKLNQLNEERRAIDKTMQQEALKFIDYQVNTRGKSIPFGLCLINEAWHQGVIGIVAARIKEHFQRPVVVFTEQERNQEMLQGSARSIEGVPIRDLLDEIAALHPHLIHQYGGHAAAAGITIPKTAFSEFSHRFNERVAAFFEHEKYVYEYVSDGALSSDEMTLDFVQMLQNAGPWGRGFSEPVFDGRFKILKQTLIGEKHLKLILLAGNQAIEALLFNVDLEAWPDYRCSYVEMVYRLEINEYKNKQKVQMMIEHLEKL